MVSTLHRLWSVIVVSLLLGLGADPARAGEFRVRPYLQNPAVDAMTVRWLSEKDAPGTLTLELPDGPRTYPSQPVLAKSLEYNPFQSEPGGPHPAIPWLHSVRITNLQPATAYRYSVEQGGERFGGVLKTAPGRDQPIRILAYSDSETEPESSTTPPVDWPAPPTHNRPEGLTKYLVDQTVGYTENLKVMAAREPDLILVTGDLVETGGEQRDWDEFWKHNAGELGDIASSVPILPALGNHENYAGPGGGYSSAGANFGTDKFLTYFDVPSNEAATLKHRGRYYRLDYGPITLITVDSSDGLPDKTAADTNHNLSGSHAPDFNPGSEQYRWLEGQLADAQRQSRFTIVQFHHTMYGSGPHSVPFGRENFSGQSGIAMRVLRPLFFQYGVDIVISGHDELLERSAATDTETLPDGQPRAHTIHFYDVGFGGDGLRGPSAGFDNPFRKFLAHDDAPEVWEGRRLISGGKHYGHLEINVGPGEGGRWQAELTPSYVFPQMDADGKVAGWERRQYEDTVRVSEDE